MIPSRDVPLLAYQPSDTGRLARRWRWWAIAISVVLLFAFTPLPDLKQVEQQMDAVTGSTTLTTTWMFGISSGTSLDVSPLEKRLKRRGITWTPSWRMIHVAHYELLLGVNGRACGTAPPIYSLRPLLNEVVAQSTDAELNELTHVLETGTDTAQQAAIDAAASRALSARP